MSEENEGEEGRNGDFSEEFKFYFSFTKPLVLDLPTEEERSLAAAWVQKLEEETESEEERKQQLNYLKMLLFVLQRGRLSGIFARQPPSGPLQPFPQGLTILDMGNLMLDQDDDFIYGGGDTGCIPYSKEISNDMREYVASQEVPNFGVQMYYAWSSDEPIHKWSLFDEEKFPQYIIEKIKQMKATKYNEKSKTDKCENAKMPPNFSFCDILTKKKVKSPEEIEESQGRSFLTYMGLVGRMGSFNDKCDDDPEKYQRQTQARKCAPKKKRASPSSGAAEESPGDDFDNYMSSPGLNSLNRPCLCNISTQQTGCPSHGTKKRPQSSCFEAQQQCVRGNSDSENGQWSNSAKCEGRNRFDGSSPGMMAAPPQRNNTPRSPSMNRRALFQTPNQEASSGGCSSQNDPCVCSSPPCTCPCPRVSPKSPCQKTPAPGGRVGQSPSRTFNRGPRPENEECNLNRTRGVGPALTSFNAPEPCTPASTRPDMSPVGGRTFSGGSGPLRPVVHCYDNQNPDPALTKTIEKNENWMPLEGGGVKYMDTDYKAACVREQMIMNAMQNKCTVGARRGLFDAQQPGPSGMNRIGPGPQHSSPLATHPLCDYSNEQESFSQSPQSYGDSESDLPDYNGFNDNCAPVNTKTHKKPQSQAMARVKNGGAGPGPGPFAVGPNTGRLANMSSILKGMKQKTEAHRAKCEEPGRPRTPAMDPCYPGNGGLTQPKSFQKQARSRDACPPTRPEQPSRNGMSNYGVHPTSQQQPCSFPRGHGSLFQNRVPQSVLPNEAYDFNLYRMPTVSQEDNETYCEDDDADADSSGSMEDACQNQQEDWDEELSEQCQAALNRRAQDYYKLNNWDECDFDSQESNQHVSLKDDNQYVGPNTTPVEFVRMMSMNDSTFDTEWAGPKRNQGMNQPARNGEACVEESRHVTSTRTSPGRAVQMASYQDDSQIDEACNRPVTSQPYRNRYMEQSMIAAATGGRTYQPACSTPLRHYKENFKDRKMDDASTIH